MSEERVERTIDITGEAVAVDLRNRSLHLKLETGKFVEIAFSEAQELEVTSALQEHKTRHLRVRGIGEIDQSGSLRHVNCGATFSLVVHDDFVYDENARPIEDVIEEISKEIPQEEWDRLPHDLTDRLDYYLYGQGE